MKIVPANVNTMFITRVIAVTRAPPPYDSHDPLHAPLIANADISPD